MSTYEEGGEVAPLPVSPELAREEGANFLKTDVAFRASIEAAMQRPSKFTIDEVDSCCQSVERSIASIEKSAFFKTTADEALVRSVVGTVLHATEQNHELDTKIEHDYLAADKYPEGLRDFLVERLLQDDDEDEPVESFFPRWIDLRDLESLVDAPTDALVYCVCDEYKESIQQLYVDFRDSGKIAESEEEQYEREKQRDRIITVSLASAGAFIASSLAYAIFQKRQK